MTLSVADNPDLFGATEGPLLMSPIVFAECSVGFRSAVQALAEFADIQVRYDPISPESAFLAGQIFLRYHRKDGPREHLVPDFHIAVHATRQADRLATVDRGYLRSYFPDLVLLGS